MKNNSVTKYVVFAVFALILFVVGLVLALSLPDAQGIMRTLPYVLIGIGAGQFGVNFGMALKNYLFKKDPSAAKQLEIDTKDERNVAIRDRAKAKAFDLMLMVFGALILVFSLLQVDLVATLALVAAYLLVSLSMVYYMDKFLKRM